MTDRPSPGTPDPAPAGPPHAPLADDYRRAGFNRRLGFGDHPALLVVDVCRAYFEPGSPLDIGRPEVLDAVRSLVTAARAAGAPVLWTRVEFEPGGADGGVFYRKVGALALFDRGQPLGGWVGDLVPAPGEAVITKQGASGFFGTDLDSRLRAAGVDTVIVCGVSTSGCVRASALDACQHDLIPIVVEEACGDRDPAVHHASLFDLDAKYADVEPLAAVLAHLADGATVASRSDPPAC
ncbi:MAG: isochorismatase family protein [Acidimicrobiales bacterium]